MENKKIVILATGGDATNILYNSLESKYNIERIIIEEKESVKVFFKRRIKKLGLLKVLGQIAFILLITKPLAFLSRKRVSEILDQNSLHNSPIPSLKISRLKSVNSNEALALLQALQPALVIVNGTRILSKKVLNCIPAKFINVHAGITPKYRGVHGTYWALVNNDRKNSGVTVHFVDTGIDTGSIISQASVIPDKPDNFITYPYLQLAKGLKLLHRAIEDYFNGTLTVQKNDLESCLWYHPTIGEYLYYRFKRGVK